MDIFFARQGVYNKNKKVEDYIRLFHSFLQFILLPASLHAARTDNDGSP